MATISHRRSAAQNLSHIRIGGNRKLAQTATESDIADINRAITYLNQAKMATSQAQLFSNVSEAFRITYRVSSRYKP